MKADLHMHTTLSDGRLSAFEVIKRAKDNKVDIIAITDHDVCQNVQENIDYASSLGIRLIPGIELSTVHHNKPVHLLGYFKDDSYQNEEMTSYYKSLKNSRENRARKMIKNLSEFFDINIEYDEVYSISDGIIARPHMARCIVNNYKQYSFDDVFIKFIGDDSKAYIPSCEMGVAEGIELLKRNNCVVVLAHPTLLKKSIKDEVLKFNFDGIEAIYLRNQEGDESYFKSLAKERNMIITAGSDFHGIPHDSLHGDIGDIFLEEEDINNFLKNLGKK